MNKRMSVILSGLMISGCLFAAPPPSAKEWKAAAGVNVEQLTPEIVAIRYDLTPDKGEMNGNYPRKVKDVDLMFQKPIRLTPGTERILFEAHGVVPDNRNTNLGLELRPIIRDQDGEVFHFFPKEHVALQRRQNQGWDSYTTAAFHSGEAGAASHGTCTVGGNITNSRPDGVLELVGFRLHLTQPEQKDTVRRKGVVYLGDITVSPLKVPFSNPSAFTGAFLDKKGNYTFAGQIRTDFQGTPVQEFANKVTFDPADIAGSRKRIEFKLGPNGHYWINYQITNENGGVEHSGSMKYQMFDSPDKKLPVAMDLSKEPSIGYMRVNPGHKGNGVYELGEQFRINVRVFPKGKKDLKLKYVLSPYFSSDVLKAETLTAKAGDMALNFAKHPQFNVFRLQLELLGNGKTIDSETYIFGEKTDFSKKLVRAGKMTDRRELKNRPYQRLSYVVLSAKRWQKPMQFYVDDFQNYLNDTFEFTPHGTICPELNDFEVLPGVFDFYLLDEMMNRAADLGCKLTVRFAHADNHAGPYRWGKFSRQISADGVVAGAGISYGAYEVNDPALVKLWLDSYRALYKRYSEHTAFAGYYIMLPAGEWVVVDQPWDGIVSGYSDVAKQGFRDYLKTTLKLDLAGVNRRWGTNYRSFEEVLPPVPSFELASMPDLRVEWLDFCRYKAALGRYFWMPTALNDIRSYDDNRVTIAYGGPNQFNHIPGKLDYGHNGGNHSLNNRGAYYEAWQKYKTGWITEPIHPHGWAAMNDPGKGGWVLDVSVWTMLAQAGPGGSNLHVYYFTLAGNMAARYGGFYAFDRFEKMKPMLREVHDAELIIRNSDIVVNQDRETLFTKHRTTFSARLADLQRWFELLDKDGVSYAKLADFPDRKFKLLLPNILDEVISESSLKTYEDMVKNGARIIIAANTGKYVPENGKEPFQLLKAFKITPPTQKYVQTGNVKAKALKGNPLFAEDKSIDFQTLTTFREQSHSPEVRKSFWQYPYRWIPETDYFGYYPGQKPNGKILAVFPDGGAAMTLHQYGKGEVIVFWGTPDISSGKLKGMMARASEWAGIKNAAINTEIPDFFEMSNPKLKRHYGFFYAEKKYGSFQLRFPNCPDGEFYGDEMITDRKLGVFKGKDLREKGISIPWEIGESPLKAIRFIPSQKLPAWKNDYGK